MKYPIEKMRKCLALLPPPGGEVVAECLDEIELLRQQLAAKQAEVEQAFREGFRSPATYNDVLVNDEDTEWENYKRRM